MEIGRRAFNQGLAGAIAAGAMGGPAVAAPAYRGPNVIIVRFGGGVRRTETIADGTTYSPYFLNVLAKRGTLIPNLTIAQLQDVDTSHAEGTLNILTGRYKAYEKVGAQGLAPLLEPSEPTLFEALRKSFDIPAHQALLINGEDRPQEEYLTYGGHKHFGVSFRSEVVSLFRYKLHKFRRILEDNKASEDVLADARKQLDELTAYDFRNSARQSSAVMDRFWDNWREQYGDTGLKNPRGDRLLTELAVKAMRELKPRLMMINYQDPDYVHWGNASHYTRAIAIIDQGLKRLVETADSEPAYRQQSVFVIVPDCGRDANPLMSVPYQHHFNSRSAHEIFALLLGPGIAAGKILDKPVDQTSLAATVGAVMGFPMRSAEGRVLSELLT
ncbi:MAG: hypothetical protein AAGA00_04705 [Pseudomonadota bacterium]